MFCSFVPGTGSSRCDYDGEKPVVSQKSTSLHTSKILKNSPDTITQV
jgi:hypothetical protein